MDGFMIWVLFPVEQLWKGCKFIAHLQTIEWNPVVLTIVTVPSRDAINIAMKRLSRRMAQNPICQI